MRDYEVIIDGKTYASTRLKDRSTYNPHALDMEVNISNSGFGNAAGNSIVTLWGVPFKNVVDYSKFHNKIIRVYAGTMGSGAGGASTGKSLLQGNNAAYGEILYGNIWVPTGYWEGTEQKLEFFVTAAGHNKIEAGKEIEVQLVKGKPLQDPLNFGILGSLPNFNLSAVEIDLLGEKAKEDKPWKCASLAELYNELRKWVNELGEGYSLLFYIEKSKLIIKLEKTTDIKTPVNTDKTTTTIYNRELIGQPAWNNINQIIITTVMRGDLTINQRIKLEGTDKKQIVSGTQSANSGMAGKSWFVGSDNTYKIVMIRHQGRYRQASGNNWVTMINAVPDGVAK